MNWPWPYPTRRDIAGVAFAIVLLVVALYALIIGPELSRKTNYGFGPEWDCVNPGKLSALSCIKRPAKPDHSP
jgi:hypothetical protein